MSTTLSLYWNLASPAKDERLDASVKLISALQSFQKAHIVVGLSNRDEQAEPELSLDDLNAQDVSYALRRLVRGLASARESSRLGFAVALTEVHLLHRFLLIRSHISASLTHRHGFF
jgi:DNA polymerase phi